MMKRKIPKSTIVEGNVGAAGRWAGRSDVLQRPYYKRAFLL